MTKPRPLRTPKRVLMLGFENAQILDVTGPFQIIEAARTRSGEPAYEIELIAPERGPFRTSCGLTLTATRGIDEIGDDELGLVHSLLVAGGMGTRKLVHDARMIGFIRRAAARTKRTVSVCTGALLLAGAGLLDGKRAATFQKLRSILTPFMCGPEKSGHRRASPRAWISRWRLSRKILAGKRRWASPGIS